jgi:hypothetical protein
VAATPRGSGVESAVLRCEVGADVDYVAALVRALRVD